MSRPPRSSSKAVRARDLHGGSDYQKSIQREQQQEEPRRAASFHGKSTASVAGDARQMRRPNTETDLLIGRRSTGTSPSASPRASDGEGQRLPAKILVNVAVQRSLGAMHIMASTEWSVGDLVKAALQQYTKAGRRPLLPSNDPSSLSLHYSQFCLQSLDPKEKLIDLGSRNFFLCPKTAHPSTAATSVSTVENASITSSCSNEVKDQSKMGFLLWMSSLNHWSSLPYVL